jgi:hypothetical protein
MLEGRSQFSVRVLRIGNNFGRQILVLPVLILLYCKIAILKLCMKYTTLINLLTIHKEHEGKLGKGKSKAWMSMIEGELMRLEGKNAYQYLMLIHSIFSILFRISSYIGYINLHKIFISLICSRILYQGN